MATSNLRYLELLSKSFPTAAKASAEIINLKAILNLPKGTEFFCSDIHGEAEAFSHILRNASGSIRMKVDEVFGDELTDAQKRALCRSWWRYAAGRRRSTRARRCAGPCRPISPTSSRSS